MQAEKLVALLSDQLIVVGGDETIGKGLVWTRFHPQAVAAAAEEA